MLLLRRVAFATACILLCDVVCAAPAGAQVYASEHALAQQTANGTIITVEYYRPVARGRELFGSLVKWGREWTPGANWATTIDVDHDVTIEGHPLPKGKYSVWTVPQPDTWSVILSRKARAFHTAPPPPSDEQLRFTVKPMQGLHAEMLTWSFPMVTKEGAELHMQWGTTDLPLHLGVGASAGMAAMSAEERAKYVGTYRMTRDARSRTPMLIYTVFDSAGMLRLRRTVGPDAFYDPQFDLVKTGEHAFQPITYRKGVLTGLEPAFNIVFSFDGDRATGLEVRGVDGTTVMMRGEREEPRVASPLEQPSLGGPTAKNLSGAWATGTGGEPSAKYLVQRPECNYSPGFWSLEQQGDTVRAYTVLPSHAQGIATREQPERIGLEGRMKGGVLTLGDSATGYRLRYDPASGHLRGTYKGESFWAVPLQFVWPSGCIPVP